MGEALPLILVEGILVFGGVIAFAAWQLRDVRRTREAAERAKRDTPTPGDAP